MNTRTRLLAIAAFAALAACSPGAEEDDRSATPTGGTAAEGTPAPASLRETLLPDELEEARLTGELGCAFTEKDGEAPLLVAMADVRADAVAEGVLKLGPTTLRLRATEPGGFNAMGDGAGFASGDLAARVVVTSPEPLAGGESPPRAARLEIVSESGSQQIEGEWTCGP